MDQNEKKSRQNENMTLFLCQKNFFFHKKHVFLPQKFCYAKMHGLKSNLYFSLRVGQNTTFFQLFRFRKKEEKRQTKKNLGNFETKNVKHFPNFEDQNRNFNFFSNNFTNFFFQI